jgi:AraC family transcriptional regulator of adaptative response / DNA-3-methyladenine glycosylase II
MDHSLYEQARQSRDPRFDGRFFIGVRTTKIYCRPVCPVKIPMAKNVAFYPSAAAAAEAGFRPCLRCRPESAPGTPAWLGTCTTVRRALRLIAQGALDNAGVDALSARLGVGPRHLSRLFNQHLGASPIAVAQTRRLHFAKTLIDQTQLPMTDVALSSGYGSVRRFNDHFKRVYQRSPSSLRSSRSEPQTAAGFQLYLSYRQPFDFAGILAFLQFRAIPGVETVTATHYSRTVRIGDEVGYLHIGDDADRHRLSVRIELAQTTELYGVLERVKRLFDVAADPMEIHQCFDRDSEIAAMAAQNPGQRVPGGWDSFEIAVRAIVGQQVSVKGATTVMGRIARAYGSKSARGQCFPNALQLSQLDTSTLSMPVKRAQAIKDMSTLVAAGQLSFDALGDSAALIDQLISIKGIGPWTAQYIAMRALNDPDAFLAGDLVLQKVARARLNVDGEKALLQRSLRWSPWRAYAGMHLWRHASGLKT